MKTAKQLLNVFAFLLCVQFTIAQDQNADIDLIPSYEDYTEMDRELVYAHLNKSIYIKGESIGFKAYVLDKYTKRLATQAANLYCVISDATGKIIENKLLIINNGTAIGDFEIGDTYTSGYYTIKIYTNWMRNFNEQNLFVENIRIIDPEIEKQMTSEVDVKKVDAQFLPEGGHSVSGVENTIGVIIKNDRGLGLPDIEGEIVDQDGMVITNFKVNQFGIGKCLLTPKKENSYTAKFTHDDTDYTVAIKDINSKGIVMSLNALRDKIALTVRTNESTLSSIKDTFYKLAIHNGEELKEIVFKFGEQTEIVRLISRQDLFSGLNIFTIFDAKNNPLLERLYFNYDNVNFQNSEEESVSIANDSVAIVLPYKIDSEAVLNSFSVSVLPSDTNSFHHHNIASQILLQPYLKGYVEQAQYYFKDITPKKQFELDKLLITQGWSSYDWSTIFNDPPEYDFDYENGISYTFNSSDKKDKQLMIYPTLNHPMKLVTLSKENSSYTSAGLFPIDDESVRIREINEEGKVSKPNLYLQFDPIKIPEIESSLKPLVINVSDSKSKEMDLSIATTFRNIQKLDEVVINKKKEYTEIEKLNNRSIGTVEEMDETMVKRYRTLDRYLRDKGFFVQMGNNNNTGDFVILNNSINSFRARFVEDTSLAGAGFAPETAQEASSIPIVYLNDIILHQNLNLLQNMSLEDIEWIEVNKTGVGGGMRAGGAGLIRIKTRSVFRPKINTEDVYSTYDIPLNFSVAKKFYIPIYSSYETDFFKEFGVIDWIPDLNLNEQGQLEFKIANKKIKSIKIFVEGIINNSTFVSEEKELKIDQL
nr:hypothetical protein [uncultured Psychroserpens sp.]